MSSAYPTYASKNSTRDWPTVEEARRANSQYGSEAERRAENLRREAEGMGAREAEDLNAAHRAERKVNAPTFNGWGSPIKPRLKRMQSEMGTIKGTL